MPRTLHRGAGAVTAAALALLPACSSEKVTSPDASTRLAVTTRLGNEPVFQIQNLDGRDAQRLRFLNVVDDMPGNSNLLTVTDDAVLNISEPRWSRTGDRVAVVVSVAFDQSEVVVFDPATGRAEVASPNTQVIFGHVDWSQPGTDIAYTMSTVLTSGVDLFTTNLASHVVRRLTTGANLGQSVVRWDVSAAHLYFSQHIGDAKDAAANWISQVARVNVSSGVIDTVKTAITGQVLAISRGGQWALVRRFRTRGIDTFTADLVRLSLVDGSETPLVANEMITRAQLSPEESRVLVAIGILAGGPSVYDLIDLLTGSRTRIPGVGGEEVEVDVSPRPFLKD